MFCKCVVARRVRSLLNGVQDRVQRAILRGTHTWPLRHDTGMTEGLHDPGPKFPARAVYRDDRWQSLNQGVGPRLAGGVLREEFTIGRERFTRIAAQRNPGPTGAEVTHWLYRSRLRNCRVVNG
jgi:hypothetical protein